MSGPSSSRLGCAICRLACVSLGATLATSAAAQEATPVPVACNGQRVSEIVVASSAPTVAGARRVPLLREFVRTVHVTTDPALTRRYLLLTEGGECTELRRTESERVLRAQPFLADASVVAYDAGPGRVRIEVHTIDEVSFLAAARMSGESPFLGRLRLGNSNLGGRGLLLSGEWRSGGDHRDGYALSFADYQLAGQRWVAAVDLRRDLLGGNWRAEIARPYLTDLQRDAWRLHGGASTEYIRMERSGEATRAVPVHREFADVGMITRIGPPRRLGLLGLSLSHERERTGQEVLLLDDWGARPDSVPLAQEFSSHTMGRVNLLGGVRLLDFVRVRGFDGLSATQDFPVGVQAGVVVGRSTPLLGAIDDDWLASLDLYAARGSENQATRIEITGEGRYDRTGSRWDGIVASGALTHYAKAGVANTTILSAEWAGMWHPRTPGWLELGARDGGMRGFAGADVGGARRTVLRAEQRRVLGRVNGTAEFGAALFVEGGRVWAGESPWGITTPWRSAFGASILAAVPVRSARLWRVDLAIPSTGGGIRNWEVRVSRAAPRSPSSEQASPLDGMRARAVPGSVFRWP